ncbi:hypothetical protein L873DRAFT_410325 [Choiromyces venosus 120613-1]|uniref:Uncharacterized protein n=1 Tax=Choiromyces venosus 120613-1 TaxID=1336337 RepID=A0A3N4K001_9PEZI|nr:hypothetical protein L873DRAFT_410325 [Choiromyces venosus 120613-1]
MPITNLGRNFKDIYTLICRSIQCRVRVVYLVLYSTVPGVGKKSGELLAAKYIVNTAKSSPELPFTLGTVPNSLVVSFCGGVAG